MIGSRMFANIVVIIVLAVPTLYLSSAIADNIIPVGSAFHRFWEPAPATSTFREQLSQMDRERAELFLPSVFKLVSETEIEVTYKSGEILLGEYSVTQQTVRVVIMLQGNKTVEYYDVIEKGLRSKKDAISDETTKSYVQCKENCQTYSCVDSPCRAQSELNAATSWHWANATPAAGSRPQAHDRAI